MVESVLLVVVARPFREDRFRFKRLGLVDDSLVVVIEANVPAVKETD